MDSNFTLEECERVLSKLFFRLIAVESGYRYYAGMGDYPITLRNSKEFPMHFVEKYLCKRLGLELWTFAILASENPSPL